MCRRTRLFTQTSAAGVRHYAIEPVAELHVVVRLADDGGGEGTILAMDHHRLGHRLPCSIEEDLEAVLADAKLAGGGNATIGCAATVQSIGANQGLEPLVNRRIDRPRRGLGHGRATGKADGRYEKTNAYALDDGHAHYPFPCLGPPEWHRGELIVLLDTLLPLSRL